MDKRGEKATITIFKRIALTYHTHVITNMYGYLPAINRNVLFGQYVEGNNNINRPILSYDGNIAYFINGETGVLN